MKVLIIGDNGHGEYTAGKRTPSIDGKVIHEHEFNQPTCDKFLSKCKSQGFETLDVAPGNEDVSLELRTDRANEAYRRFKKDNPNGVCLFVSFHYNALNGKFDSKIGGVSTYSYPGAKDSQKLAGYVQIELAKGTPIHNRGIKTADFHVLRRTAMTAILCECGFMDKLSEANLMLKDSYQEETAKEAFNGVLNYLINECGLSIAKGKTDDEISKEVYLMRSEIVYLKKELEKEQKRNEDFRSAVKVIMKGVI